VLLAGLPVKVFPKTSSLFGINSFGAVVGVTVSFEGSMPESAGAALLLYDLCHGAHLDCDRDLAAVCERNKLLRMNW
jgi:hypothetical protein